MTQFVAQFSSAFKADPLLYEGVLDDGDGQFNNSRDIQTRPGGQVLFPVKSAFFLVAKERLTNANLARLLCQAGGAPASSAFFQGVMAGTSCNPESPEEQEALENALGAVEITGREITRMTSTQVDQLMEQTRGWTGTDDDVKRQQYGRFLDLFFSRMGPPQEKWVERHLIQDPEIPILAGNEEIVRRSVIETLRNPHSRGDFLEGLVLYEFELRQDLLELKGLFQPPRGSDLHEAKEAIARKARQTWHKINPSKRIAENYKYEEFRAAFFHHLDIYVRGIAVKHLALIFPNESSQPPALLPFIVVDSYGRVRCHDEFLPEALFNNMVKLAYGEPDQRFFSSDQLRLYVALISTTPYHRRFLDRDFNPGPAPDDPLQALQDEERNLFLDAFDQQPDIGGWAFHLDDDRLEGVCQRISALDPAQGSLRVHREFLANLILLDGFLQITHEVIQNGGNLANICAEMIRRLGQVYETSDPDFQEISRQVGQFDFAALFNRFSRRDYHVNFDPEFRNRIVEEGETRRIEAGFARLERDHQEMMAALREISSRMSDLTRLTRHSIEQMEEESAGPDLDLGSSEVALTLLRRVMDRFAASVDEFQAGCAGMVGQIRGQERFGFQALALRRETLRGSLASLPGSRGRDYLLAALERAERLLQEVQRAKSSTAAAQAIRHLHELDDEIAGRKEEILQSRLEIASLPDRVRFYLKLAKKSEIIIVQTERLKDAVQGYQRSVRRFAEGVSQNPGSVLRRWPAFVRSIEQEQERIKESLRSIHTHAENIQANIPADEAPEFADLRKAARRTAEIVRGMEEFIDAASIRRINGLVMKFQKGLWDLQRRLDYFSAVVLAPVARDPEVLKKTQLALAVDWRIWSDKRLYAAATGAYLVGPDRGSGEEEGEVQNRFGLGAQTRYRFRGDPARLDFQLLGGALAVTQLGRWSGFSPLAGGGAGVHIPLVGNIVGVDINALYLRDLRGGQNLLGLQTAFSFE